MCPGFFYFKICDIWYLVFTYLAYHKYLMKCVFNTNGNFEIGISYWNKMLWSTQSCIWELIVKPLVLYLRNPCLTLVIYKYFSQCSMHFALCIQHIGHQWTVEHIHGLLMSVWSLLTNLDSFFSAHGFHVLKNSGFKI